MIRSLFISIVVGASLTTQFAAAEDSIEVAGFLYFDRCFPKHNVCIQINNQLPNVTVTLQKASENSDYTTFKGTSDRKQDAFNHHYNQSITVEKIVTKGTEQIQYNLSGRVTDENAVEVIHPFYVIVRDTIGRLNTLNITGVSFNQPEWESTVTPRFYLGQPFVPSER